MLLHSSFSRRIYQRHAANPSSPLLPILDGVLRLLIKITVLFASFIVVLSNGKRNDDDVVLPPWRRQPPTTQSPSPERTAAHRRRHRQDRRRRRLEQDGDECLLPIGNILRGGSQDDYDGFGSHVSISQNGRIVGVGARGYDGAAGAGAGLVQVFENVNNSSGWMQRGTNIEGENANDDLFANALSNDGNILAVGAPYSGGNGSYTSRGHVRVYQYNATMDDWQQLGDTLEAMTSADEFGFSVALSGLGTILAVGAISGGSGGQARVFWWNGSGWTNRGNPINGQNNYFGFSVALAENGNTLAVGAPLNGGSVRVFAFADNSDWNQLGQDLYSDNARDLLGLSVSLSSDGHAVAIGAPGADSNGIYSNGILNRGQVQVYALNENNSNRQWAQRGSSLTGSLEDDYFGDTVSLSGDGALLVVGAESLNKTFLRLFQWNGTDWQQFGADDDLGVAVAVSRDGSTIVAGADGHPGWAMVASLEESCLLTPPAGAPASSPTTRRDSSSTAATVHLSLLVAAALSLSWSTISMML